MVSFGIRDFPYLNLEIQDFRYLKLGTRDWKYAREVGMSKITRGITGLPEIFGRDYGIEERYWPLHTTSKRMDLA